MKALPSNLVALLILLASQISNAQDDSPPQQIPADVLSRLREGAKAGNPADQCQLAKHLLGGETRSAQVLRLLGDAETDLRQLYARVQFYLLSPEDKSTQAEQGREKFKTEQEKFKKLKNSIEQKETAEAVDLLISAASRTNVDAILCLRGLYFDGKRVQKDLKRSAELDLQAANLGSAFAMGNVGYDNGAGAGVTKDIKEAVKWFEKGCEKGNLYSCYWLARVLTEGGWEGQDDGYPRNPKRAYALGRALRLVGQPNSRATQWGTEVTQKARAKLEPDDLLAAEAEGEKEAERLKSHLNQAPEEVPPNLKEPAKLTKDQWKSAFGRKHPNFALAGVVEMSKGSLIELCGEPTRTQTVGDTVFWYFECKDGTIQFELDKGNLLAGRVVGKANDY